MKLVQKNSVFSSNTRFKENLCDKLFNVYSGSIALGVIEEEVNKIYNNKKKISSDDIKGLKKKLKIMSQVKIQEQKKELELNKSPKIHSISPQPEFQNNFFHEQSITNQASPKLSEFPNSNVSAVQSPALSSGSKKVDYSWETIMKYQNWKAREEEKLKEQMKKNKLLQYKLDIEKQIQEKNAIKLQEKEEEAKKQKEILNSMINEKKKKEEQEKWSILSNRSKVMDMLQSQIQEKNDFKLKVLNDTKEKDKKNLDYMFKKFKAEEEIEVTKKLQKMQSYQSELRSWVSDKKLLAEKAKYDLKQEKLKINEILNKQHEEDTKKLDTMKKENKQKIRQNLMESTILRQEQINLENQQKLKEDSTYQKHLKLLKKNEEIEQSNKSNKKKLAQELIVSETENMKRVHVHLFENQKKSNEAIKNIIHANTQEHIENLEKKKQLKQQQQHLYKMELQKQVQEKKEHKVTAKDSLNEEELKINKNLISSVSFQNQQFLKLLDHYSFESKLQQFPLLQLIVQDVSQENVLQFF